MIKRKTILDFARRVAFCATIGVAGGMAIGFLIDIYGSGQLGSDDDGESDYIYPYGGDAPTPDNGLYTVDPYCINHPSKCGILHFTVEDGTDLKVTSELTGLDEDSQPAGYPINYATGGTEEGVGPDAPPISTSTDQKTDYKMVGNDAVDFVVPAPAAYRLHIKMGNTKHRTYYVTPGCRLYVKLTGSMDNGGDLRDPVLTNIPEMTPNGTMKDSQGNPCGKIDS
jgi:hypothetical protein